MAEFELPALRRGLQAYSRLAANTLSIVEVSQAMGCYDPSLGTGTQRLLKSVDLVAWDANVLKRAAGMRAL